MVGIDISGVQPDDVPGNWEFITVKATEKNYAPNPRLAAQWRNAARTDRGLYHYAVVGQSSPQEQAAFFAQIALGLDTPFQPGVDHWQLDCEGELNAGVTPTQWQQFIPTFMDLTLAKLGPRGLFYAGWYFIVANGLQPLVKKYKWWIPAYGVNDGKDYGIPSGPDPADVVVHQFTSFGGLDQNKIIDPVRWKAAAPAPAPTPAPVEDDVTYFYQVTGSATVPEASVWVTDFIWTRHVGSPGVLAEDQLWAAFEGAPHVEVHKMDEAFHNDLWQKPVLGSAPAPASPAPTHFTGTVDIKAAP